jgi:hypothetical protein
MISRKLSVMTMATVESVEPSRNRHSYQIINSKHLFELTSTCVAQGLLGLLRVIRKGLTVKSTVDDAIDRADIVYNLRDAIEEARTRADQATDDKEKRKHAQKGM